jgi:hypothetical protein
VADILSGLSLTPTREELIGLDAASGLLCSLDLLFDLGDEGRSFETSVDFRKMSQLHVPTDSILLSVMIT